MKKSEFNLLVACSSLFVTGLILVVAGPAIEKGKTLQKFADIFENLPNGQVEANACNQSTSLVKSAAEVLREESLRIEVKKRKVKEVILLKELNTKVEELKKVKTAGKMTKQGRHKLWLSIVLSEGVRRNLAASRMMSQYQLDSVLAGLTDRNGCFPKLSYAEVKWIIGFKWGDYIRSVCEYYGADYNLVISLIACESAGDPWAVNDISKATGLGQLVVLTAVGVAKELGIPVEDLDRSDPYQNILLCCLTLRSGMRNWHNQIPLALTDYWVGIKNVRETVKTYGCADSVVYVKDVIRISKIRPKKAPDWAISVWDKEQWVVLAEMRQRRSNAKYAAAAKVRTIVAQKARQDSLSRLASSADTVDTNGNGAYELSLAEVAKEKADSMTAISSASRSVPTSADSFLAEIPTAVALKAPAVSDSLDFGSVFSDDSEGARSKEKMSVASY